METFTLSCQEIKPEVVKSLADTLQVPAGDLVSVQVMVEGDASNLGNGKRWISPEEAAMLYRQVAPTVLGKLIAWRVIPTKGGPGRPSLIDREEVARIAQLLDRDQWQHLENEPMTISEAAVYCGVSQPTASRWVQRGNIRALPPDPNDARKVLVCRADVEYAKAMVEIVGARSGRKVFLE